MKAAFKFAVVSGVFFVLAMCSGKATFAAPLADLCTLLTPAQIQKVLGQPFGAPSESKALPAYGQQPWGVHCDYTSQKGPDATVTFIAYADSSAAVAKQTFDKLSMWFPPRSKPSGIGDSAYIDNRNAIHVLKSQVRYYISIDSPGGFTPAKEKQLKDLALSVAAKI
jgi:hypothetical protein